jgi:hypothetical protein
MPEKAAAQPSWDDVAEVGRLARRSQHTSSQHGATDLVAGRLLCDDRQGKPGNRVVYPSVADDLHFMPGILPLRGQAESLLPT